MNLLDETVHLLKSARQGGASLRSISCEPDVPYEWLKKFAGGVIPDPSVNRIQALHSRLSAFSAPRRRARPKVIAG